MECRLQLELRILIKKLQQAGWYVVHREPELILSNGTDSRRIDELFITQPGRLANPATFSTMIDALLA